jgi:IS5 family transposase
VTPTIKRELRRRSAVEPVIGHLKAEHRMGRNYLWFRRGDAAPSSLPPATTSAASSDGSGFCCTKS